MQSFHTESSDNTRRGRNGQTVTAGRVADFPQGSAVTVYLSDGSELALYNINGEFYATESRCPHQGAPLASGSVCGHIVECFLHGWQFDVRTGESLTVSDRLEIFPVTIEEGMVKILIRGSEAAVNPQISQIKRAKG